MIGWDERSSAKRARAAARRTLEMAGNAHAAAAVREENARQLLRSVQRWVAGGVGAVAGAAVLLMVLTAGNVCGR